MNLPHKNNISSERQIVLTDNIDLPLKKDFLFVNHLSIFDLNISLELQKCVLC